jgi:hypothetical protein
MTTKAKNNVTLPRQVQGTKVLDGQDTPHPHEVHATPIAQPFQPQNVHRVLRYILFYSFYMFYYEESPFV